MVLATGNLQVFSKYYNPTADGLQDRCFFYYNTGLTLLTQCHSLKHGGTSIDQNCWYPSNQVSDPLK